MYDCTVRSLITLKMQLFLNVCLSFGSIVSSFDQTIAGIQQFSEKNNFSMRVVYNQPPVREDIDEFDIRIGHYYLIGEILVKELKAYLLWEIVREQEIYLEEQMQELNKIIEKTNKQQRTAEEKRRLEDQRFQQLYDGFHTPTNTVAAVCDGFDTPTSTVAAVVGEIVLTIPNNWNKNTKS